MAMNLLTIVVVIVTIAHANCASDPKITELSLQSKSIEPEISAQDVNIAQKDEEITNGQVVGTIRLVETEPGRYIPVITPVVEYLGLANTRLYNAINNFFTTLFPNVRPSTGGQLHEVHQQVGQQHPGILVVSN